MLGESCCRILNIGGGTSTTAVGGTCEGLTGGCRPSDGRKGTSTTRRFGRMGRTCSILDSRGGHGLCSRFNRTTFRRNTNGCKGTRKDPFNDNFNKTRNGPFNNNFRNSCDSNGNCRRCRFRGNRSVSSVLGGVFNNKFGGDGSSNNFKDDNFNNDKFRKDNFNKFKDGKANNFNNSCDDGNRSLRTRIAIDFSRTTFNNGGIVHLRDDGNNIRGCRIGVPTNVRSNGSVELGKGKCPKINKNRTNSLLLGMGIRSGPKCGQRNESICAAMGVPFAATMFNNRTGIRAVCNSILYGVGPNARSKAGVHLENGNVITVGGPSMRNSRCTAMRVRIPAGLAPRTEQGLGRFRRRYGKDHEDHKFNDKDTT